jgi:glycerol-3-phosphate dehydrogenase
VAVNYASLSSASPAGDRWRATVSDTLTGRDLPIEAKVIVNAAGPFVDRLNAAWDVATEHRIVYSKGIHLVVPQLTPSERVLAFFDDSQRLFYVIPMAHRSVIGTTDTRTSDPEEGVSDDDRYFVLKQINARLNLPVPLTVEDVIAERSGVRPLVVLNDGDDRTDIDWTTLSRKHEVEVDQAARLVTIFGGKLTDCLNVGDEVVEGVRRLGVKLRPPRTGWYGEPPARHRRRFIEEASQLGLDRRPDVERETSMAKVLWRRHGTAASTLLELIRHDATMAEPILAESDIIRAELGLYAEREMIVNVEDFLRRRTKLAMLHRADRLAADPGMDEVRSTLGV